MRFIDITDHRYGRLVVLDVVGRDVRYRRPIWLCLCDCGNTITVSSNRLRSKNTTSCGCWKLEKSSKTGQANRKHGESQCGSANGQPSREYRAWHGLRDRCLSPKNKDFAKYGGRGITVCERWNSFENFLADMGRCPPERSLDRINNDGNYEPSNCRWATPSTQNKNRRPLKRDKSGSYC